MPDQQDFEALRAEIDAVDSGKVREPNRPVEVAAREAEMTALWAQDDKSKFDESNFDWSLVEQMPVMAGAARWAEAQRANRRRLQEDAQKLLKQLAPQAQDLRDELLYALDYAGDEDKALQARIVSIREGDSYADLVLDCPAVVDLAGQHRALLEGINCDLNLIDELEDVGDRLAAALGGSDVENLSKSEEKALRDRAFTLLDDALRKVRKCGKYVCRNDEERMKGYYSEYNRAAYRRSKRTKQEQPAL